MSPASISYFSRTLASPELRTRRHCPEAILQLPVVRERTHRHREVHNLQVEHLHTQHLTLLGQFLDSLILHPSLYFLLLLFLLFLQLHQALFLFLGTLLPTHPPNIILQNTEALCCKDIKHAKGTIAKVEGQRICDLCIFL